MEYDFQSSASFSPDFADKLNQRVSQLSPLLYVFCYYSPRPYRENVSASVNFWTAVINTQALFNDCFPYKKESLKNSFFPTDDLYNQYRDFKEFINWLRGMYCHNNSIIDGEAFWKRNRKNFCQTKKIKKISNLVLSDEDYDVLDHIPTNLFVADKIFCEEDDWIKATKIVCVLADGICGRIDNYLSDMISKKESNKINTLLNSICVWTLNGYMRRDEYLYRVAEYYKACGAIDDAEDAKKKWTKEKSINALDEVANEMLQDGTLLNGQVALFPAELMNILFKKGKCIEKNRMNASSYYPIIIEKII